MTQEFTWSAFPSRVVFAPGAVRRVPDEVARLEMHRVLVIGGGASAARALDDLRDALGHHPVEHQFAGEMGAAWEIERALAVDVEIRSAARGQGQFALEVGFTCQQLKQLGAVVCIHGFMFQSRRNLTFDDGANKSGRDCDESRRREDGQNAQAVDENL